MDHPIPGKWTFKYHPWLIDIHDSKSEFNVGQKSAQMGYTETALNIVFYNIDILKRDCLYVLPAKNPDAGDFSASRFDPALELSEHLSKLFSDVKNVGHKRAGTTNLFIRGSRSRSGLKSIPVGTVILDEVDEMDQNNIPLVKERMSGQFEKYLFALSTPTLPEYGINNLFLTTTQEEFSFRCPHCSRFIFLTFPESLFIPDDPQDYEQAYILCNLCKHPLSHEMKHEYLQNYEWVSFNINNKSTGRGFHINQLYSSTIQPKEIAQLYHGSQNDPAAEQEFFNSKLGLPHIVSGAQIDDSHINNCISNYQNGKIIPKSIVTMGADVGKFIHVEIDEWFLPDSESLITTDINIMCLCKVIYYLKIKEFDELDNLIFNHSVQSVVIDALPERRKAFEFASRYPGYVKMCFYGRGVQGKQIHIGHDEEPTIVVDRTSWLDLSLGRFKRGKSAILLPMDTTLDYRNNIKALVKIYSKDADDNPVASYVHKNNVEDHYAHARNYSEIALKLALSRGSHMSSNII